MIDVNFDVMRKVIVTTDFSQASRHAFDYTCMLLHGKDVTVELLHIFTVPVSYTMEGVAIAAMNETVENAEELLKQETDRASAAYPDMKVQGKLCAGDYLNTLIEEVEEVQPDFIVFGTDGTTDDFFGEDDLLSTLRNLPAPVLFVPTHAAMKPIRNIAYACNYAGVGPHTPTESIIDFVQLLNAGLKVVHADTGSREDKQKELLGEEWLSGRLAPVHPSFYWQQGPDVLQCIIDFVVEHEIDCVMMVPKKQGFWEQLFYKSRTKALIRMNRLPIMAFRPKDVK